MKKNNISRREFFRTATLAAAATAGVSCTENSPVKALKGKTAAGNGTMTYRKDKAGEDISILGYGCMRWPMKDNGEGKDVVDQEAVDRLVDYAIAHGVNYFDTAPVYLQGQSEAATGLSLKRYPRESWKIATKLSNMRGTPTKESSIEMYQASLKNLQVDYIDFYLLHSIASVESYKKRFIDNGVLDYMVGEREKGTIRNLGFSCHCDRKTFDFLMSEHEKYHWDFVQIQMNYIDWMEDAEYLYKELEKRNIPVVIMEPLLGGRLAKIPEYCSVELQKRRPGDTIASWAFRFCGTFPGVMTVLSGMTYMEHLQDNLKSFSPLEPLSEEDLKTLGHIAAEYVKFPLIPCTDCKYCMPCPYGVDIPSIFRHYNKCLNDGLMVNDKADPRYRKARRAYLVSLDRNVEKLRQANHCIGCGQCTSACPQRIRIPANMVKIDEYVENLKRNK